MVIEDMVVTASEFGDSRRSRLELDKNAPQKQVKGETKTSCPQQRSRIGSPRLSAGTKGQDGLLSRCECWSARSAQIWWLMSAGGAGLSQYNAIVPN